MPCNEVTYTTIELHKAEPSTLASALRALGYSVVANATGSIYASGMSTANIVRASGITLAGRGQPLQLTLDRATDKPVVEKAIKRAYAEAAMREEMRRNFPGSKLQQERDGSWVMSLTSLATDKLDRWRIWVLEDGRLKIQTSAHTMATHINAERMRAGIQALMGGSTTGGRDWNAAAATVSVRQVGH